MKFNKKKFIEFFIKNKGVSFFDKGTVGKYSGKPSARYFNWRTISEDVNLIDKCADYVIQFVLDKRINPDCFLGIPEGATKLALILQYKWARKYRKKTILPFVRGKVKEHGSPKDRNFLGVPEGKILLIEDVVVRGGAVIETIKRLKKLKIRPYAVLALSDRTCLDSNNTLIRFLKKNKIRFYSLTNQKEVVAEAIKILKPSKEILDRLEKLGKIN